ncbi:AcrR family transcriptional regulator [Kitasatospora sp. MAA4]|uniref:TetR/AcrR family transcriptional regulator n=1 Tax=Kitasatospora sp. MAA4 TaxID=3035093 RepID=UPI0024768E0C|nr:TetR/AcrR family transcriptional regulator [Kitasatospora sp. MAA4]MDH6132712.1 AcrR family transcriptional regulator [Kitasatospora sp. MAA4]
MSSAPESGARRPHTGRRRNEEARQAILDAALRLTAAAAGPSAGGGDGGAVSIDAIAREARVGKQTIYRWWPSKSAVLLDALASVAEQQIPPSPARGSLHADLAAFLADTFRAARREPTCSVLHSLLREAAQDPHASELLRLHTAARRAELRALLAGHTSPQAPGVDLDLLVDQAYGFFWYRFLLGHAPLDDAAAEQLARSLAAAATANLSACEPA